MPEQTGGMRHLNDRLPPAFFVIFPDIDGTMHIDRRTLLFIVAVIAAVETLIILYNNATGYVVLGGLMEFLVRLAFGVTAAVPVAVLAFMANNAVIRALDRFLPWERSFARRIPGETILAAMIGALLGAALTAGVHGVAPYADGLGKNIVNNALIAGVLNVLIMAGLEAFIAYRMTAGERQRAETLERENADIRFMLLKTQLNPHFLFNSLNVLSSLITRDATRAQAFVEEFSAVYRYILEVIDLPVVELRRELEFARSYMYLQSMRFTDAVRIDIDVVTDQLELQIPPLALQTVVENAFKHNRATAETPLRISIVGRNGVLTVTNNLQPRTSGVRSTGVGLENLRKRFNHLGAGAPSFTLARDQFTAVLPLMTAE
jgi:two-component system LytT family sensor kinase